MPEINVEGYEISFPYEPYECQVDYMTKVMRTLSIGGNAILESPTGTGKTLCILCSVLAWQKSQKNIYQCEEELKMAEKTAPPEMKFKIFYLSRTHNQLQQVIRELKKTTYKPTMTILGSRGHLCLNNEVHKIENNMLKTHVCRDKVKKRTCAYYVNYSMRKDRAPLISSPIFDIEEALASCKGFNTCPYYSVRELIDKAQIIFMPYSYLIDPKQRKSNSLIIKNSIIIIDEAHNIDKVCEDCFSTQISIFDISSCLTELDTIITLAENNQPDMTDDGKEVGGKFKDEIPTPKEDDVLELKGKILKLEKEIITLNKENRTGLNFNQIKTFQFLQSCGFDIHNIECISSFIDALVTYLTANSGIYRNKQSCLDKISDFLSVIFSSAAHNLHKKDEPNNYYRLCITSNLNALTGDSYNSNDNNKNIFIMFWCFSPGLAIEDLKKSGSHSIIFTSGTLSPMDSFESELQLVNSIKLQNPHIVTPSQLKVYILPKGHDDTTQLISTFAHRSNEKYLDCLGQTIYGIIRHVPGGILIFFSSYSSMQTAVSFWKKSQTWNNINKLKKIVVESKNGETFQKDVQDHIHNSAHGSIFMAVCRGKVSEGFDSANDIARAVIITGLPYPSKQDKRVQMKMDILAENNRSSSKWYSQQAIMSVNQAIGRVIRHREDYGMVFLLDERFQNDEVRLQLSKWVNKYITKVDNFSTLQSEIPSFFSVHLKNSNQLNKNAATSNLAIRPSKSMEIDRKEVNEIYNLYKSKTDAISQDCKENEKPSIFSALKRKSEPAPVDKISYDIKPYNIPSNKCKLKFKYDPYGHDSSESSTSKSLMIIQICQKFRKELTNKGDYLIVYNSLKRFAEDKELLTLLDVLRPKLTYQLFCEIEKILNKDQLTCYKAYKDIHYPENQELGDDIPETVFIEHIDHNFKNNSNRDAVEPEKCDIRCLKCNKCANYQLPCNHQYCRQCIRLIQIEKNYHCYKCNSKFKIEKVQQLYFTNT